MTIIDEIVKFIKSDIDEAFDMLDEVFGDINSIYCDLNREYTIRPNNFDMETFRSKLRRFVKSNRKDIVTYYASINLDSSDRKRELSDDIIYEMLCKLNFKEQVKYFNLMCKCKKSLIPFVVRANDDFGQNWLCTRLIKRYGTNIHEPIPVDLEATGYDLEQLVEYLIKEILGIDAWQRWENRLSESTIEGKIEQSKRELVRLLYEKTKTATQFVIIKNAFSHIDSKSDKFLHFCNLLVELNHWMYETDYKCILIFVEKRPDQYTCQEYLCTHTHDSFEAMKMVDREKLRIVGLKEIEEFSESDIKEWLEDLDLHDDIRDKLLNSKKSFTELIAKKHPEQVIRDICIELNVTFQEKWIKH